MSIFIKLTPLVEREGCTLFIAVDKIVALERIRVPGPNNNQLPVGDHTIVWLGSTEEELYRVTETPDQIITLINLKHEESSTEVQTVRATMRAWGLKGRGGAIDAYGMRGDSMSYSELAAWVDAHPECYVEGL